MPADPTPAPSIFGYSDFRTWLRDAQAARSRTDRKFSHRFLSGRVGASSSGWFADLLKGRVNLAGTALLRLAEAFGLDERETDYFEALVHFGQAASLEERNRHLRKLLAFKEMKAELVGREKFAYYGTWYHSALRELLFFHDFRGDFAALGRALLPPIKAAQAKESLELLAALGFVKKDAQGRWRPATATLKKDSGFKSAFTANYLKANMELGLLALESLPKESRHVSAMTLSFSDAGYRKALAEIEALRRKLVSLMEEDPRPEKVYQCNLQFFPVTR